VAAAREGGRAREIFDRRDEGASNIVVEPLALTFAALGRKVFEAGSEYLLETASGADRQALEQTARLRVGGEKASLAVDRDQSGAQSLQIFAAAVEGDEEIAPMTFPKQAVLDLRCRHGDKGLGVLLTRAAIGGGIDHARDRAIRREYRGGDAHQPAETLQIVLAADNHDLPTQDRGRAESIRAAQRLRPEASRLDVGLCRCSKAGVADHVEHHPVGCRESDDEIRPGDLVVQRTHLGQSKAAHEAVTIARPAQTRGAVDMHRRRLLRIEPGREAAPPALADVRRQHMRRHGSPMLQSPAGFGHRV
jgi:hypothetical protein